MPKTIKELFADAGVENAELESAMTSAVNDAKGSAYDPKHTEVRIKKALTQRDEYKDQLLESEVSNEGFKKKIEGFEGQIKELGAYKTKVESWEKKTHDDNRAEWDKRKPLFDVKEGDKLYPIVQKVKDDFSFGEDLTDEQISTNLGMLKTYDKVEYFKGEKDSTKYNNRKPDSDHKNDGEFYGYESKEALARADWKLYEKWKKEHKK